MDEKEVNNNEEESQTGDVPTEGSDNSTEETGDNEAGEGETGEDASSGEDSEDTNL